MRSRRLVVASLFIATLLPSAYAQQEPSPAALLGKWKASAQHPSGATVVSHVQFGHNMQFTTSNTVDGNPILEASGSWKVSGRTLEWRYERSSHPAIQNGFIDTDEIESVSAGEIVLVSKRSGRRHSYQRVE